MLLLRGFRVGRRSLGDFVVLRGVLRLLRLWPLLHGGEAGSLLLLLLRFLHGNLGRLRIEDRRFDKLRADRSLAGNQRGAKVLVLRDGLETCWSCGHRVCEHRALSNVAQFVGGLRHNDLSLHGDVHDLLRVQGRAVLDSRRRLGVLDCSGAGKERLGIDVVASVAVRLRVLNGERSKARLREVPLLRLREENARLRKDGSRRLGEVRAQSWSGAKRRRRRRRGLLRRLWHGSVVQSHRPRLGWSRGNGIRRSVDVGVVLGQNLEERIKVVVRPKDDLALPCLLSLRTREDRRTVVSELVNQGASFICRAAP